MNALREAMRICIAVVIGFAIVLVILRVSFLLGLLLIAAVAAATYFWNRRAASRPPGGNRAGPPRI
jgi:UPF0716 family protein affecting phage T7 exclusion